MLRKPVAAGAPVVQAIIACAPEPLMRAIWAATETSDGLKCSWTRRPILPLFSGYCSTSPVAILAARVSSHEGRDFGPSHHAVVANHRCNLIGRRGAL